MVLFQVNYNQTARPKRAAPATPVKPVGKAAAAFPLLDPVAEAEADSIADEAAEAAEPARLVALLNVLPTPLVTLAKIELPAELREVNDEAAPLLPVAAAELRLARLLERADPAESRLEAAEDWAEPRDPSADVTDAPALEVMDANELVAAEAAEAAEALVLEVS